MQVSTACGFSEGWVREIVRRYNAQGAESVRDGHHRYQWMYVFGFVHPASGHTERWLTGGVNTPAMSAVLAEFAHAVGAGTRKRVLLVLDRAGWHVAKNLVVPEGIHLVHLPASTPELQPAERLWPPLREAVANESFADLAALDAGLSERCSQLSAQREYIAACTRYHWWPQT